MKNQPKQIKKIKKTDQDIDQGKSPNQGKHNVEEEVQGKITEVEESTKAIKEDQETNEGQHNVEEEVQGKITEVGKSAKSIEEDQETDQDIDQGKSPNEGQNNVEEKVQGNITQVEESTKAIEEDQETGQGKSLNVGQKHNEDVVLGNRPHGESDQEEIDNEVEEDGHKNRSKYGIIDAIITNAVVPTGKIIIKYDTSQPRSLLSRKLANSLKACCKCNNSNIAFVNLCIPSMYGFSYIKWHFDTSKDLKDDCILGQDYLMDRNTSPLTLYRIMNLAKQKWTI